MKTDGSYTVALMELESLIVSLEENSLPLDELLSVYSRGAQLLQFCRSQLEAVDHQIKVLDEGALKPWTPT